MIIYDQVLSPSHPWMGCASLFAILNVLLFIHCRGNALQAQASSQSGFAPRAPPVCRPGIPPLDLSVPFQDYRALNIILTEKQQLAESKDSESISDVLFFL